MKLRLLACFSGVLTYFQIIMQVDKRCPNLLTMCPTRWERHASLWIQFVKSYIIDTKKMQPCFVFPCRGSNHLVIKLIITTCHGTP